MCDIWPGIRYISPRLRQNTLMIVAVQQRILDITLSISPSLLARAYPVCLQASPLEDHEQPALIACRRRFRDMVLHREHMGVSYVLHGWGGCVQIFLR